MVRVDDDGCMHACMGCGMNEVRGENSYCAHYDVRKRWS